MVQLRSRSVGEAPSIEKQQCHLVTGGGGYAGFRLGLALRKAGHKVALYDVREPVEPLPDDITFIQVTVS